MSPARLRAAVDRGLEAVLALLMAGMVLNVLWQVFTRFALRDPSSVTEELARFALVWVGLLGAGYGFGRRLHLAVDLLAGGLTGTAARARLELAIQVCVSVFALSVLVAGGGLLVRLTLGLQQTSAALGVPLGYVYLALPLSGLVVLFYAALAIAESAARLRGT